MERKMFCDCRPASEFEQEDWDCDELSLPLSIWVALGIEAE